MTYLAILLVLLQIGDWWTTRRVLKVGGREANPVMRWVIGKIGIDAMLALKLIVGVGVAYGLTFYGPYALGFLCAAYAYVVWHNWRNLRSVK